jgi:hypothetical protein
MEIASSGSGADTETTMRFGLYMGDEEDGKLFKLLIAYRDLILGDSVQWREQKKQRHIVLLE